MTSHDPIPPTTDTVVADIQFFQRNTAHQRLQICDAVREGSGKRRGGKWRGGGGGGEGRGEGRGGDERGGEEGRGKGWNVK